VLRVLGWLRGMGSLPGGIIPLPLSYD
jgi:hypothetical protein